MKISVKTDIKKATRFLTTVQRKQIPFAVSQALNDTAFQAREDLQKALPKHLHNPTPWTIRGVRVLKSSKRNLRSRVYFAPDRARYMKYQIAGGTRTDTEGTIVMPKNINLNRYGNIPRGKIRKLLQQPHTFIATIKGVPGVWQRGHISKRGKWTTMNKSHSTNIRLLARFEDQAQYRPRFPMKSIVVSTTRRRFRSNFNRRLAAALRNAR